MAPAASPVETTSTGHMISVLRTCVHDVFGTMVGLPLEERTPLAGDALRPQSNVVGQIGFGGSHSGLVVFYATFDGAGAITQALLGTRADDQPSRDEIADAIGEITNMVGGAFRTRMATEDDAWAISIPTVTTGSDFYLKPLANGRRTLLPFGMGDHEVCVELLVTRQVPAA